MSPGAIEICNPAGAFPAVLTVDHGGAFAPAAFGDLGLDAAMMASHHALDRGAADCARALGLRLGAPVVICHVSRLVIDCNRWLDDPRSILTRAGDIDIPGNRTLSDHQRRARQDGVFWPYHRAIADALDAHRNRGRRPMLLAVHSFVRWFDGQRRPWDVGTLWHDGRGMADALRTGLGRWPGLVIGDNAPYSGRDGLLGVDIHCYGQGIAGCGVEIADDKLQSADDRTEWAARLDIVLRALVEAGFAS